MNDPVTGVDKHLEYVTTMLEHPKYATEFVMESIKEALELITRIKVLFGEEAPITKYILEGEPMPEGEMQRVSKEFALRGEYDENKI